MVSVCSDFGIAYDGTNLIIFSFSSFPSSTYLLFGASIYFGVTLTLARQPSLKDESSYLSTRYPQLSPDSRPTKIIA